MNENDLRDCFAMFALHGLLGAEQVGEYDNTHVAKIAYTIADAMIEARNAEPEQEVGIVAAKTRRKKND
jgi:hypothetical protein